jgi:hypothetical protein
MSDYLGPNQTRVIDSDNRNFESVVYQRKKPPLSCEASFDGKLSAVHSQDIAKWVTPSGWDTVGQLKNDVPSGTVLESACYRGDVLTSPRFNSNTFKLIGLDKGILTTGLVAWVNGWKVLVQGSNNPADDNNLITLAPSPSITYRVDFVFLEVWRKLITLADPVIYKYGNILYGGINYPNDLMDPAAGIETSLRIQTQYRIRVVSGIDIQNNPEGFDPLSVFVQGPLPEPISNCSQAYFSSVPGDPGLWRAGAGDSAAQETLDTVDGYTYAIPMFAVARRNTSHYSPDLNANGAGRTLANYIAGSASDRPDNLYSDLIAASDILDLRHRVSPTENLKEICENGFDKLLKGKIQSVMAKETIGEDHFGKVLVQADGISSTDYPWFESIGGIGADDPDGYRRVWSNAQYNQMLTLQTRTVYQKTPNPGTAWTLGDTVSFSLAGYPAGTIFGYNLSDYRVWGNGLSGKYILTFGSGDINLTGLGTDTLSCSIGSSSLLLTTTDSFTLEYLIIYSNGPNGFSAVPDTILEFRSKDSTASIASMNMDIRDRNAPAVITTDGTKFNMLSNRGAAFTEPYNFGHQMIYHAVGNGTSQITFGRTINGYPILGVARAMINSADAPYASVVRNASTYTMTFSTPSIAVGKDVELWLYTGMKFFETNKQGRAIVDTLEMKEFSLTADGINSTFYIDASSSSGIPQPIIAIASNASFNGIGYGYLNGTQTEMSASIVNINLPTDTTSSYVTIKFDSIPSGGTLIEVPLLMKSAVNSNETYVVLYQKTPYQGRLNGSGATGVIETSGPAITTTSGSGAITNFISYGPGTADFANGSTAVFGHGTNWLGNIQPGYVITGPDSKQYTISSVYSDTEIILSTGFAGTSQTNSSYAIEAKDVPSFGFPNVIDRLPAVSASNDSVALSESFATNFSELSSILTNAVMTQIQDIVGLPPDAVGLGSTPVARGMSRVSMPPEYAPLGLHNLGLRYSPLTSSAPAYQKTYQSYILNKDETGKLYLVVVGSESGNNSTGCYLNHTNSNDSVDIFELPGRPLTNRKVM